MRRALLTAGSAPPLVTVGVDPTSDTVAGWEGAYDSSLLGWSTAGPATATGVLTKIRYHQGAVGGGASGAFFTLSPAGVVTATTPTLTLAAGLNTYTVSLAVNAGDYLGVWVAFGGEVPYVAATGPTRRIGYDFTGAPPLPGASMPAGGITAPNSRIPLYGTNT